MKILMLADVFFPDTVGGAGRVAYHLSRELAKEGMKSMSSRVIQMAICPLTKKWNRICSHIDLHASQRRARIFLSLKSRTLIERP